jgi:hypothetical protein
MTTNTPDKLLAALDRAQDEATKVSGIYVPVHRFDLNIIRTGIAELTARAEAAEARVAELEKANVGLVGLSAMWRDRAAHILKTLGPRLADEDEDEEALSADYCVAGALEGCAKELDAAIDALAGQPKDSQP